MQHALDQYVPAGHKALNTATSTFIFNPIREVLQKFS